LELRVCHLYSKICNMKLKDFILSCLSKSQCYSCGQEWHFFCLQCSQEIEEYTPYCYVCKKYSENFMIHDSCNKIFPHLKQIIVLTRYRTPIIKKILRLWKYHNKKMVYSSIMHGKSDFFKEYILSQNALIVPVPMHFVRKWKRWYNQAELIASHLSKSIKIPINTHFLIKTKYTKQQSKLSIKERYENLGSSFGLKNHKNISKNTMIYLVDDIVSTWSTLWEISQILTQNWYKNVSAVCLASD